MAIGNLSATSSRARAMVVVTVVIFARLFSARCTWRLVRLVAALSPQSPHEPLQRTPGYTPSVRERHFVDCIQQCNAADHTVHSIPSLAYARCPRGLALPLCERTARNAIRHACIDRESLCHKCFSSCQPSAMKIRPAVQGDEQVEACRRTNNQKLI